jgi:hypothetical protein
VAGVLGGAVVAVVVAFVAGMLVANAVGDDSSPATTVTEPPDGQAQVVPGGAPEPAISVPGVAINKGEGSAGAVPASGFGGGRGSDAMLYGGGCPGPLPGVLSDGRVDPALGGFPSRWLGEGFQFAGLAIRGERDCSVEASPAKSVLETTWLHSASGAAIYVRQAADEGERPNVIYSGGAEFGRDGYRFTVYPGYMPMPAGTVTANPVPEDSVASSPALRAPDMSQMQAAVEDAVNQLAAGLDLACFYRQRQGTWDDAVAAGIGDPRGAIPATLKEAHMQLMLFDRPAASCNAPALEGMQALSLNALFGDERGMLSINVSSIGPEMPVTTTGQFGQGNANWSSAKYQFWLNWEPTSLPDATVRAIAARLDPGFGNACLVEVLPMTEAEARAAGIIAPTPPEGFRLEPGSTITKVAGNGNCGASGGEQGFRATWMLFADGPGGVIIVEAAKGPQMPGRPVIDYYDPARSLFWIDANGVSHAVSGVKADVSRETLLAVAKSVDPGFDESKLTTPPGQTEPGQPIPMPAPAEPPKPVR